jgi:hypothetical protein
MSVVTFGLDDPDAFIIPVILIQQSFGGPGSDSDTRWSEHQSFDISSGWFLVGWLPISERGVIAYFIALFMIEVVPFTAGSTKTAIL